MEPQSKHSKSHPDKRIKIIQELLIQLASGNLNQRALPSPSGDDIDAVITGINMLAEELRSSTINKDYLDTIFEAILDMVVVLDAENKVESINQPTQENLGYQLNHLNTLGFASVTDLTPIEYSKLISELNIHKKIKNYECNFVNVHGDKIPVSMSLSKLIGNKGEEKGVLITARDISGLKKIKTELKNRNDELNTFIYKLSHDLRGPLSSIIGLTDIAGKELSLGKIEKISEVNYYVELIRQSALKLDGVLRALNEVIHLRQSKSVNKIVKLKHIAESVVKEHFSNESKFSVFINIPEKLEIRSDPKFLELIFSHLIDNSFQFKNKKQLFPFCEVSATEMKKFILIKIKDNGRGISEEHLSKIFTMFHRATADIQGSGLGLFIVKSVVEKLDGEIQVYSKIGEGTEFLIFIPN